MKRFCGISFLVVFLTQSLATASFEENSRRYLSGQEILRSLGVFFDFSKNTTNKEICTHIQAQNASDAGANSPATGEPTSPAPNQGTILWITGCVQNYLSTAANLAGDGDRLRNLLGADTVSRLGTSPEWNLRTSWSLWTPEQKRELIRYMVEAFLGPDEVITDFGFIENPDEFRKLMLTTADARKNASVLDIVTLLAVNLSVRDEFLSY
jgi:hypothetical protein